DGTLAIDLPDELVTTGGARWIPVVFRNTETEEMHIRTEGDSVQLEGRMMLYNEWTEVNSSREGRFLERFAPGSLTKAIQAGNRIRVLFEHGLDFLGRMSIATIDELRDEPDGVYFRASLLDGLPPVLVNGLRR